MKKIDSYKKRTVTQKLNRLGSWLVDRSGLDMKTIVNKILSFLKTPKDQNDQYQYPLSLLYKTGKFPEIKFNNGKYSTQSLSSISNVLDDNGKWHPVNKLNTNYSDISELLSTLFEKINLSDSIINSNDLKTYLKTLDLYTLIKNNISNDEIKTFVVNNRINTVKGEQSENSVKNILESKGMTILYQGGDGDFIDMLFGIDLIMGKDDKIYLIQVKSSIIALESALKSPSYKRIDWFCAPKDSGIIIYTKDIPTGRTISK